MLAASEQHRNIFWLAEGAVWSAANETKNGSATFAFVLRYFLHWSSKNT